MCASPVARGREVFPRQGTEHTGNTKVAPRDRDFALGEARESLGVWSRRGFCYSRASVITVWGRFSDLKNNGEGTSGCVFLPWKQICLLEF